MADKNIQIKPPSNNYGDVLHPETNAGQVKIADTANKFTATNVEGALLELFTNASDGKTAVANAVTAKGVSASGADTFTTLATKIGQIPKGQGSAVESQVLSGATFSNADGVLRTGNIPNMATLTVNGVVTDIREGQIWVSPSKGYYNGSNSWATNMIQGLNSANIKANVVVGDVNSNYKLTGTFTSDANAVAGNIYVGKTAYVNGNKVTGTMPWGTTNITPNTTNQYIREGYHDGTGYVVGDANLLPTNIVSGKSIFGVVGSAIEGKRWASGNFADNNVINTINLSFTPSTVLVECYNLSSNNGYTAYYTTLLNPNSGAYSKVLKDARINVTGSNWNSVGEGSNMGGSLTKTAGQIQVLTNQIKIKGFNTGELVYWTVIE